MGADSNALRGQKAWSLKAMLISFLFFFFNIYLFIWLHWVLVVARGIFVEAWGIFRCSARASV